MAVQIAPDRQVEVQDIDAVVEQDDGRCLVRIGDELVQSPHCAAHIARLMYLEQQAP